MLRFWGFLLLLIGVGVLGLLRVIGPLRQQETDATLLLVSSNPHGWDHELYIVSPQGEVVKRVTYLPGIESWPALNGDWLYFTSAGDGQIYRVRLWGDWRTSVERVTGMGIRAMVIGWLDEHQMVVTRVNEVYACETGLIDLRDFSYRQVITGNDVACYEVVAGRLSSDGRYVIVEHGRYAPTTWGLLPADLLPPTAAQARSLPLRYARVGHTFSTPDALYHIEPSGRLTVEAGRTFREDTAIPNDDRVLVYEGHNYDTGSLWLYDPADASFELMVADVPYLDYGTDGEGQTLYLRWYPPSNTGSVNGRVDLQTLQFEKVPYDQLPFYFTVMREGNRRYLRYDTLPDGFTQMLAHENPGAVANYVGRTSPMPDQAWHEIWLMVGALLSVGLGVVLMRSKA